jgi:hypothetical protein
MMLMLYVKSEAIHTLVIFIGGVLAEGGEDFWSRTLLGGSSDDQLPNDV